MNLKDQVISFETAKRLDDLGISRKSIFQWCLIHHPEDKSICEPLLFLTDDSITLKPLTKVTVKGLEEYKEDIEEKEDFECSATYPAYTAPELSEMWEPMLSCAPEPIARVIADLCERSKITPEEINAKP